MTIDEDYQYGDEWDWDKEDPRQYCKHGTFIGSWWGPDIMCFRCEIGDDDDDDETKEPLPDDLEL